MPGKPDGYVGAWMARIRDWMKHWPGWTWGQRAALSLATEKKSKENHGENKQVHHILGFSNQRCDCVFCPFLPSITTPSTLLLLIYSSCHHASKGPNSVKPLSTNLIIRTSLRALLNWSCRAGWKPAEHPPGQPCWGAVGLAPTMAPSILGVSVK